MPDARRVSIEDFRNVCFVIMPFGTKEVGSGEQARTVDFDAVYESLFRPAVEAVVLPEAEGGGRLLARRTDRDFFAGHISQAMFEYIEYSRFALADITGLNANVFYELGARHRAHESGTAIFRQEDAPIPFDINQIKAFPYSVDAADHLEESRAFITRVLTESLVENAWDSPIMLALREQFSEGPDLQELLRQAEDRLRADDAAGAHELWMEARKRDSNNPRLDLKASAFPKQNGDWDLTIRLLQSALANEAALGDSHEPSYSDAYRELGIAQNKRDRHIFPTAGEESLRKAVYLSPGDFDAWASLGGILRRAERYDDALAAYDKAVEVSEGHPYPLLMAIKLRTRQAGRLELSPETIMALGKAQGFRTAQARHEPSLDAPWCFFDLAEIELYLGKTEEALEAAKRGLEVSSHDWMPETFASALGLLEGVEGVEGLTELQGLISSSDS
jgi:tetratricopeptide (TPR) repeat protein